MRERDVYNFGSKLSCLIDCFNISVIKTDPAPSNSCNSKFSPALKGPPTEPGFNSIKLFLTWEISCGSLGMWIACSSSLECPYLETFTNHITDMFRLTVKIQLFYITFFKMK
jgi:hypothetical protein